MDQIGKYRILEKIGQGATSAVYKGYDDALGRYVAVKTISADAGADETLRKRFEREAQSAARLAHPHIVTVYDFGQEQGKLYMAMELLEGADLKQAIAGPRLLTLDQKLDVMEQIADGLAFAHAHGIVHRDLKPANIRLLPDGQAKIMDFGLARHAGSDMTRTGLVLGTPYYMSPEQMRGEKVDGRSDVFSLGCVFYELLTGQKPFQAESLHTVLYKVMQSEPRPPRQLRPEIPPGVEALLGRALAKERADRFADGGELLRAVQQARAAAGAGMGAAAAAGESRQVPPAGPTRPAPARRAPLYVAVGLVAVVGLVGAVAVAVAVWNRRAASSAEAPRPVATPRALDTLTRQLVDTEVEVARAKLGSGDHEEAVRRAERALSLDPAHPAALDVRRQARAVQQRQDDALVGVRAARTADASVAAGALWALLEAAPDHPAGDDLVAGLDASYRPRADEARRLMEAARRRAEEKQGARLPAFQEGADLARSGEAALAQRRFAQAARAFMRARARYERAGGALR